ncbi:hypothetical protein NC651_031483 [Populus alba x Populus x berolinensis]|nr:hypothetical protein NC651_031483 [Populus alba x Populus x berolinensis]
MCSTSVLGLISMMIFILFLLTNGAVSVLDHGTALTKSLLYYEAQRSGKLPPNQSDGDSGLKDGGDAQLEAKNEPQMPWTPSKGAQITSSKPTLSQTSFMVK